MLIVFGSFFFIVIELKKIKINLVFCLLVVEQMI